jgi:hypothetical protein
MKELLLADYRKEFKLSRDGCSSGVSVVVMERKGEWVAVGMEEVDGWREEVWD